MQQPPVTLLAAPQPAREVSCRNSCGYTTIKGDKALKAHENVCPNKWKLGLGGLFNPSGFISTLAYGAFSIVAYNNIYQQVP